MANQSEQGKNLDRAQRWGVASKILFVTAVISSLVPFIGSNTSQDNPSLADWRRTSGIGSHLPITLDFLTISIAVAGGLLLASIICFLISAKIAESGKPEI